MTNREYKMLIKLIDLHTEKLSDNYNGFTTQINGKGIEELKKDIKEILVEEDK